MTGTMHGRVDNAWQDACKITVLVAIAALAGCSSTTIEPDATQTGMACVDDSKACIDQRQNALKSLLADKNRAWVKQPVSPAAYASGVRMFAFKTEKTRMACDELASGKREAEGAPQVLRGPSGQGLTLAQVSRGVMFAAEVGRELGTEMKRRCKV